MSVFVTSLLLPVHADAFSLLGPFAPWMTETNGYGYIPFGDIGGPMNLGEEYRWNVPVVTYGFDQTFLDYFGTNGVLAVEAAIGILNDLPPASQLNPASYPTNSTYLNFMAEATSVVDLKSQVLIMLLEEFGLGPPTRNIFDVRQLDPFFTPQYSHDDEWPAGTIPNYIIERNFDPQTQVVSHSVNGTSFGGWVVWYGLDNGVREFALNPLAQSYSAVADRHIGIGQFYSGLTRDDVGGLRYLLSSSNVNYETLLPGVRGAGANPGTFVNGAWRPGVDKVVFIPHDRNAQNGQFASMTNQFIDVYIANNLTNKQQLERVIDRPDFLFTADDLRANEFASLDIFRTGASNWINLASENGNSNGPGPGIIQPPITITLGKLGLVLSTYGWVSDESLADLNDTKWARYDFSTNAPIILQPPGGNTNQTHIRAWLLLTEQPIKFEWMLAGAASNQVYLQTSTNLTAWVSLAPLTNDGIPKRLEIYAPLSQQRFYRLSPQ